MDEVADDERLWACARGIDAVQEAERLGSWRVGVEHLLSATLLDPVARRLFLETTGESGSARLRATRPVRAGVRSTDGTLPRTTEMTFDSEARAFLVGLVEGPRDDLVAPAAADTDWWRHPDVRSTSRRRLLHDLLTAGAEPRGPVALLRDLADPAGLRRLAGQLIDAGTAASRAGVDR